MDIRVIAVDPPTSFPWAMLFFVLWPFLALLFSRRETDVRALIALPLSLAISFVALGFCRVAQVMSLTGPALHAVAAGLAESLIPVVAGCGSGLLVLLFTGIKRQIYVGKSRGGLYLALVLGPLLVVAAVGFGLAGNRTQYSSAALSAAVVALSVSVACALISATVVGRFGVVIEPSSARTAWWVAFGSGLIGIATGAFVVLRALAEYAMSAAPR